MKIKTQKAKIYLADMAMDEEDKSVQVDNETKLITGSKACLVASCHVYVGAHRSSPRMHSWRI